MALTQTQLAASIASLYSTGGVFELLTVQKFVNSTATAVRVRLAESRRQRIIVRNTSAFVGQVGFTTNTNNNPIAPGSFTDLNPGEEWYEEASSNQVFVRAKTSGQLVAFDLEVSVRSA
jgi:hypothetical protein